MNWFNVVFSGDFVSRHHCGSWESGWPAAYAVANAVIALDYFLIAGLLVIGWWQSKTVDPERLERTRGWFVGSATQVSITYSAFILLCGVGHLLDGVLSFSKPYYHLWTVWHCLTGIASTWAVVITFRIRVLAGRVIGHVY